MHTLEADSILFEFGTRKILSDIYLKCETGKIIGILGRNGEGKSCLMNIIYGSLPAISKSIRFDNASVFYAYKRPELLQYLPQFNFVPKSLTLKRIFSDFKLNYGEFENWFPEFQTKYKSQLKNLSGGESRVIEVYVIIKTKSKFTLLDEPFTHVMPLHIEKLKQILTEEKNNKGFLITDHLYKQIIDACDNLYVLSNGKTHFIQNITDIEKLGYARTQNL